MFLNSNVIKVFKNPNTKQTLKKFENIIKCYTYKLYDRASAMKNLLITAVLLVKAY